MPTSNAALAARAEFEKATEALATPKQEATPESTSADGDTPALDPSESPADETVTSGDDVEESSADSTTAATEGEPEDDAASGETETKQPKGKPRGQVRIEELVSERKALKAQVEYLQQEVLKLQPQTQAAPAVAQTVTEEPRPTLESSGYDPAKFEQELQAWADKKVAVGLIKQPQQDQQNEVQQIVQAHNTRAQAFAAKTPDFHIVMNGPQMPALHGDSAKLILTSDLGPQIHYHLMKNPDRAVRIARQTPAQQAAAIGRLEAELSAAKPSQKNTTKVTSAPPPPAPTKAGGAAQTDPTKVPIGDFIKNERAAMVQKRTGR
jgi:hypothetical protein